MKIRRFEIEGLLGRSDVEFDFHEDLNILTGRNGAGKTSILKLLWSIISGNIIIGLTEVPFQRASLVTDKYECIVHNLGKRTCRAQLKIDGTTEFFEDEFDIEGDIIAYAEDLIKVRLLEFGRSVFFPTFRRIEGGFSISPSPRNSNILSRQNRARNDLEDALFTLSKTLTNDPHAFVSAISTADIVTLLLRKYTELSELANELQADTSQRVIQSIKESRPQGNQAEQLRAATATLEDVIKRIEKMEDDRKVIMSPMDEVQELVQRLIQHVGIKFGPRLSFGDAANAVNSDALSAGEKQMLSFVCYNAFYSESIILIDEPELSLHADWQRQLFQILEKQQSSNQFIVATHSPFIYAKYPDRELKVSTDRGDLI